MYGLPLRPFEDIDERVLARTLNDLTLEEKRIIQIGLREGDVVNVPVVVNRVAKMKGMDNHTRHSIEVAMHRAAQRLYNRGLATLEKAPDGIIWITISRPRLLQLIQADVARKAAPPADDINLIKVQCEIPTNDTGSKKKKVRKDPLAIPSKTGTERLNAIRLVKGLRVLERPDKVQINYQFEMYTEEINQKIIALLDTSSGEIIGAEYSTRFNDLAKAARSLNNFDYALDKSLREFPKAVFLTLTTDPNLTDEERARLKAANLEDVMYKLSEPNLHPKREQYLRKRLYKIQGPDFEIDDLEVRIPNLKGDQRLAAEQRVAKLKDDKIRAEKLQASVDDPHTPVRTREKMISDLKRLNRWTYTHDPNGFKDLWEANRHFSIAWNKFLSYITKKNDGIRPRYIASYEYTENGLMHVHALIFLEYLVGNDEISREWRRVGQGEISYIYALKNIKNHEGKREWRWNAKARPSDAKTMSGGDYLKKYVRKCMLALMDAYTSPSDIQSLYWTFNKRMFTCSQFLLPDNEEDISEETEETVQYAFLKVFSTEEAEEYVDRMIYHIMRPKRSGEGDPPDDDTGVVV